jgi:hypothetical protein
LADELCGLGYEVKKTVLPAELEHAAAPGELPCDLILFDGRERISEALERLRRLRKNAALAVVAAAVLVEPEQLDGAQLQASELGAYAVISGRTRTDLREPLVGVLMHRQPLDIPGDVLSEAERSSEDGQTGDLFAFADSPRSAAVKMGMDQKRLVRELGEFERLLAKNSLDAKKQYHLLVSDFPGCFEEEMKAMGGCLERLDFRKARELVGRLVESLH